jgi:chromosome segregation ATPase
MTSSVPAHRAGPPPPTTTQPRAAKQSSATRTSHAWASATAQPTMVRGKGTDFGGRTTEDWEEVRLKKQLRELESKISDVEKEAESRRHGRSKDSKPALVKRELEMLLDYKRNTLRELDNDEGGAVKGLGGIREEIETVKEQVEGLQSHLERRQEALAELRSQVDDEKAGR